MEKSRKKEFYENTEFLSNNFDFEINRKRGTLEAPSHLRWKALWETYSLLVKDKDGVRQKLSRKSPNFSIVSTNFGLHKQIWFRIDKSILISKKTKEILMRTIIRNRILSLQFKICWEKIERFLQFFKSSGK